ncbi:MAG: hypothetical protein US47_C0001G0437 [Candidatus Moranbacteria bacterium GW2011_GWE1_37_24]|nr:MAG: hypothetical protein US47_C0001G0437 [Candidatus Moranbacteria bacterium GW2011_GWE1_37_24]
MKRLLFFTILFLFSFFFTKNVFAATEFISVIDPDNGSGTDYTSLSAWEAANQVDLTAATTLVIAGSLTRGTIADGTPITQTTTGATAVCVHHTETQMLISTLSGTPNATDTWFPTVDGSDATNAWTPTDAGDSAIAIAKCRSTAGTADTTAVTVDGWTTSATNYIKIWTDPSENYRHQGKWDEGKYRLSITSGNAMTILENYIRIEGLQVYNSDLTYGDGIRFDGGGELWIYQSILQGNPSATDGCRGVYLDAMYDSTVKIYNNVMYGWNSNDIYYQYLANVSSSAILYIYNNTFYGGNEHGLNLVDGTKDVVFLKNNISYNSGSNDYNLSNNSITSSNNLSSDATSPDAAYQNQIVHFTDEANQDFHLDSADTGARNQGIILYDSGDDANLNFTTDIDNNARLDSAGTWDIGADEGITKVYRSVGPSATTALATGGTYGNVEIKPAYVSGSTTNIADYVATFWSDLPTNVGVGDALQYDDDDDGDIDASDSIVFITKRIDASHYSVRTVSGTAPASTLAPDSDWSIFRSYTSLFNAEAGTENTGIDADLVNFDTWSGGKNLQTGQEQWNIAAYAGQGGVADTVALETLSWTTTADSYIKVYTPTRSDEVGVSQRHSGAWDATKYNLSTGTGSASLRISANYTIVDGLQVTNSGIASTDDCINIYGYRNYVTIRNSIIKGGNNGIINAASGVDYGGHKFYNNIVYGTYLGGIRIYLSGADPVASYIYNNTVYNCNTSNNSWRGGIEPDGNGITKNNIAIGNQAYDFTASTNQSSLASQTLSNIAFVSTTSGSEDLHISPTSVAKNIGTDLSNDPYIPFNTDIDSACLRKDNQSRVANGGDENCYTRPRGTSWDIGADELITKIYRSVAPDADGTLEALTTGASNAMTIASSTATFATALADNIGVGDAIQYDADGDGDIDASDSIVFISGRTDSTHFTVKTVSGTAPTAVSADTDWSLFRAYTSLANAETGTENLAIDADLRNFDAGNRDLASNSEQWNIACYANGTTGDSTAVTLDGWTTAPQNYIKIYTPYLTTEVGTSQRHQGKWDENKYKRDGISMNTAVQDDFIRIEGLQIRHTRNSGTGYGIIVQTVASVSDVKISDNIIVGVLSDTAVGYGIWINDSDARVKLWNNIIYGFINPGQTSVAGLTTTAANSYVYVYNNTIRNCYRGFHMNSSAAKMKNNIAVNNTVDYYLVANVVSSNNISSDATSPNTAYRNLSVSFVNSANDDFHLSPSDTSARNSGADLSQDYWLPITSDIDGHARPASARGYGVATDIGADESATPIYRSIAPSMSTYLDRGVDESGTDLTISGTTMTLENAAPDNVGVGDVIQYDSDGNSSIDAIAFISARASSTSFTVQARDGANPVAVTNDQDWQIFRAYTTLDNAEGGAENTANIDDDVDDFDISVSRNDGKDIYASNEQWNIAAYANGTTADTNAVTIDSWTTYPTNYIKIYTPVSSSEVGTSQRHNGVWDDGKYKMEITGNSSAINAVSGNVWVDGLQIKRMTSSSFGTIYGITNSGVFKVNNNIINLIDNYTNTTRAINNGASNLNSYYWNNIIYGTNLDYGYYQASAYGYLYNNSVIDANNGYYSSFSNKMTVKNNIAQGGADGFFASSSLFGAGSDYNVSDFANDAPSPSYRTNLATDVSFVDETNEDFHLSSSDTFACDAGVNLWDDSALPIREDIDGDPRSEQGGWDIGADELITYQSNVSGLGTATMQMSLTEKMTDGLVGMWSFDGPDISGTTAYDRSPAGGNDGTITGATPAIGKRGQALSFNGTTDFVDAGDVGAGIQTISFWMKTDDATDIKILNIDGTDQIEIDGTGNILATSFPSATIYVDGSVSAAVDTSWHFVTITDSTGVSASTFQIGQVASSFFDGIIDEVRIYNRVLSVDEIGRLYDLGNVEYVR